MNDKEYIKKVCSKCANRYNENDLCNIVRTMDGNYRCSNEKIKKENKLEEKFYNEKVKSDKWRNTTILFCLIMIVYEVVISIISKNLTCIVCAILWGNIALIEYFDNKLIQEKDKIIYEADKLINLQFGIINELTDDLKKLNKVKIMRINDIRIPKEFQKPRIEKMKERIEYFLQNPGYTIKFYIDKITSMWAENTYSAIRNSEVNGNLDNLVKPLEFYQKVLLTLTCVCSLIVLIQNRKNLSLDLIFLTITNFFILSCRIVFLTNKSGEIVLHLSVI